MLLRLAWPVLVISLAVFIFFDAKKRGYSQMTAFSWLIFTMVMPFIVVPAYFILAVKRTGFSGNSQLQSNKICPKCGEEILTGRESCPRCNNKLTL